MSQKSSASLSSASTESITLEYANAIPADIVADTAYFKEQAKNKDDETNKSVYPQPVNMDHRGDQPCRLYKGLRNISRIIARKTSTSSAEPEPVPITIP